MSSDVKKRSDMTISPSTWWPLEPNGRSGFLISDCEASMKALTHGPCMLTNNMMHHANPVSLMEMFEEKNIKKRSVFCYAFLVLKVFPGSMEVLPKGRNGPLITKKHTTERPTVNFFPIALALLATMPKMVPHKQVPQLQRSQGRFFLMPVWEDEAFF